MSWKIEIYENENGVSSVRDFFDNIKDKKLKAKVFRDIELLEEYGIQLTEPRASYLGDGIWELRTKQSSNIARTLYFTYTGKTIVLLHGFVKKTPKTPPEEKRRAIRHKEDYIRRHQ